MKKAARIFIVIGIVLGFPLIFPAIVGGIALNKLKKATCKNDIKLISILTLLLCNVIGGILMLCLKESDFVSSEEHKKTKRSFKDKFEYFRLRRFKKWMFCPACKSGKMSFNKKKSHWICEDCGYSFSEEYFLDNCVFWFCDECDTYLNSQEGFDRNESKHICSNCGYENDITEDNIKGACVDCGKTLSDPDAHLCVSCHQARKEKAKKRILVAGAVVAGTAAVAGAAVLAAKSAIDGENAYEEFGGVTDSWIKSASDTDLRFIENKMLAALNEMDYDSNEYLQLDLKRIDVVNEIASRCTYTRPHREHGW